MGNRSIEIRSFLDANVEKQAALFPGAYLVTPSELKGADIFPFYGNWRGGALGGDRELYIYCHKKEKLTFQKRSHVSMAMVGHAYNPFTMEYEEEVILDDCLEAYCSSGIDGFFDKLSELTGVYVIVVSSGETIMVAQDCAGLKACYYGIINGCVTVTSHPQLLDDVFGLTKDENISLLMERRFFSIGGRYLPGNLSPFLELSRLGPNTFFKYDGKITIERFFPKKPHPEINGREFKNVISEVAQLLNNNMRLCCKKWKRPAISLSGGTDSRTTLACANGLYDKFKYYSFQSKPHEAADADDARQLCESIGLRHVTYSISNDNDEVGFFDDFKRIILHNGSYIGRPKDNEIRKFVYFHNLEDFDVEIKSWVSELGRLMWERKLDVRLPKILTPRHFSIFQSRYFGSPYLLKHADDSYRLHLEEISLLEPLFNYNHADSFFWEFRDGGWASNVYSIQEIFSHTVTMPFNNRKLVDMMLWFPDDMRRSDYLHSKLIMLMNERLSLDVVKPSKSSLKWSRVILEKLYYYYRTKLSWIKF